MDPETVFQSVFIEHQRTVESTRTALAAAFVRLVAVSAASLRQGGKLMLFGNGGSAADAQHIAAELVVRYARHRPPIAAIALTTDTSVLTAAANDLGYHCIFDRQIEALGRPGDVAIGLSTSGRSVNVARGLRAACRTGLTAAALTGGDAGDLAELADPLLIVPSSVTARIQELHIVLGHALCEALDRDAGPR